jgi:hypothetical protein
LLTPDNILTIYNSPDLIKVCKKLYGQDWEELRSIVIERIIHKTELENTNMIAYSIQCAYNSFKNNIKKNSLISYEDISLDGRDRKQPYGTLRKCVNAYTTNEKRDELSLDYKVWIEHSLDKLTEKVNQDKNDFKRMYWANIYDILITHKGNILKAQRQIKLPYFEVRKAVREYEQYLKDYFKNKI